jgi:sugar phosphate isomerase/epimerase
VAAAGRRGEPATLRRVAFLSGSVWLAGHTYALRSLSFAEALDRLLGLGLEDVEVWLGHATEGPDRAAAIVQSAGVHVRAVSAGGFYRSDDHTPTRAFALAEALSVDTVVMCVAPLLVTQLDRSRPPQVRVAVENHWDQQLAHSEEVARAIESTRLHACLDTGHALAAGERPEAFAGRLGDRVVHVHLKEGRLPSLRERVLGRRLRRRLVGRPKPTWPGAGDLDLLALREALVRIGFEGCVTVEHEGDNPAEALATLAARWREGA